MILSLFSIIEFLKFVKLFIYFLFLNLLFIVVYYFFYKVSVFNNIYDVFLKNNLKSILLFIISVSSWLVFFSVLLLNIFFYNSFNILNNSFLFKIYIVFIDLNTESTLNLFLFSLNKFNIVFFVLFSILFPIIFIIMSNDYNNINLKIYIYIYTIFILCYLILFIENLILFYFVYELILILVFFFYVLNLKFKRFSRSYYFFCWMGCFRIYFVSSWFNNFNKFN